MALLAGKGHTLSLLTALLYLFLGIILWGGFNWSVEMTNTESFCISCHEMKENVFKEYRTSVHYSNRTGVRATCPDCHVPREWVHKMKRKIRAVNELYHWLRGSIDTREKFQSKRHVLAGHVWQSMKETDSRECRNCHANAFMELGKQSSKAKIMHKLGSQLGNTCIECHQGIAHTLPASFDKEAQIDNWHKNFEKQSVGCHECHESLIAPDVNEEW